MNEKLSQATREYFNGTVYHNIVDPDRVNTVVIPATTNYELVFGYKQPTQEKHMRTVVHTTLNTCKVCGKDFETTHSNESTCLQCAYNALKEKESTCFSLYDLQHDIRVDFYPYRGEYTTPAGTCKLSLERQRQLYKDYINAGFLPFYDTVTKLVGNL